MGAVIITTVIQSQGGVTESFLLTYMYLDVSDDHLSDQEDSRLTSCRPSHIRSSDVWYLPATEEDEAYQDHENVVQEVMNLVLFVMRSFTAFH